MSKRCTVVLAGVLLLALGSCRSSDERRFPGYSRFKVQTSSPYFLKTGSIVTSGKDNNLVSFQLIAVTEYRSYQMQEVSTDCTSRLMNAGGAKYSAAGSMLQAIPPDTEPGAFDFRSDLGKVALEACYAAMPERFADGEFSAAKALAALFSDYNRSAGTARVNVRTDDGNSTGTLSSLLEARFAQRGVEKHLLLTSIAVPQQDCHACGAPIGAYVFVQHDQRWFAEAAQKEVGIFGAWGSPGQARLVRLGPEEYGFSLAISDMHQGESSSNETYFAMLNGQFRPVLDVNLSGDNGGNCGPPDMPPCFAHHSTVALRPTGQQFFEVDRSESGTDSTPAGVVPADAQRRYLLVGNSYVEQK